MMTNKNINGNNYEDLKIAIVHNWLWKMRGGEMTLEAMCECFPNADIFALFGDVGEKSKISKTIKKHKIRFSILNKLPLIKSIYKHTLPLWPFVTEMWDFSNYDIVISSSASTVKGVITNSDILNICYMYTPLRYIWDQQKLYSKNMGGITRLVFNITAHFLRIWDSISTKRIDKLISISDFVSKRIEKYYRRYPDKVIYPPVDISRLKKYKTTKYEERENYLVCISAFEENKGADIAVEFAKKYNHKLYLVGDGAKKSKIINDTKGYSNIIVKDWLSDKELFNLIAGSKAMLFLGVEDFGILPLEASFLGTPVIALKEGGAKETIIEKINGFFVRNIELDEIRKAYEKALDNNWDVIKMREVSQGFSKETFKKDFKEYVLTSYSSCVKLWIENPRLKA